MEITKIKNIEAFLVTMDTEKALDSLDHKLQVKILLKRSGIMCY